MNKPHWLFTPVIRPAASAIVFLFVLSFLLAAAAYFFSGRAVNSAVASKASVMQLCETSNQFRAQQVTLWTYIIAVSVPPPRETPGQARQRQAVIRAFQAYVRQVFAPRDCTDL